jgi:hypothetical protein
MVVTDTIENPYKNEVVSKNTFIRTFSSDVTIESLVWHQDRNDRIVKVLDGENWYIQFDNFMPEKLTIGSEFYIPSYTYHRIIKGSNNLVLQITES